jgi:hypothetical protein
VSSLGATVHFPLKISVRDIAGAVRKQLFAEILDLLSGHLVASAQGRLNVEWKAARYQRLQEEANAEQQRGISEGR